MTPARLWLKKLYTSIILKRPKVVLLLLLSTVCYLGYQARNFKLDASADSLLLENDEDLRFARTIYQRYSSPDYLVISYSPKGDLFSDRTLNHLNKLCDELQHLKRVASVFSILDAPLLKSPPVPLKELATHVETLRSPTVDRALARIEFKNSPLYKNLLVNPDLSTTALQINFKPYPVYQKLINRRYALRAEQAKRVLTPAESAEIARISKQLDVERNKINQNWHTDIVAIRAIMAKYRNDAKLFLGGAYMIADDMITYIKNDLELFGTGVLLLLVITLGIIFRRLRWIVLPILCCAFSVISMMGILALFDWKVTVISSNFISLQLIITMAIVIHLIVRYRELHLSKPDIPKADLILETILTKATPCLYATLTTIAGFGSLLLCKILPVINFGLMMNAGLVVSLILTFLLFPTSLMLLKQQPVKQAPEIKISLTGIFANLTEKHGSLILSITAAAFILSIIGVSRLEVENSFIDYFKKSTEIFQGMKTIDQTLGGTTPLDIIINFDQTSKPTVSSVAPSKNNTKSSSSTIASDSDDIDDFENFDEFEGSEKEDKYWFSKDKMDQIKKVHNYLAQKPEIGKVLSFATMLQIAQSLNNGKALGSFEMALVYSELPQEFKSLVFDPYISIDHNEARIAVRIKDSQKNLNRNRLLISIKQDLTTKLGFKPEKVRLTGMMVLYNNMLQSLFRSQILTLGVVLLALLAMFLVLFRSFKIALIALFPNLFASLSVLGVMGWLNIPLDMMTITIAAISIGMAVDNTIHYIHRFEDEIKKDGNYFKAVHRCHGSIGHAMYYTSLTIIIGFSILSFSNFIPTIYFGLFTGLAMLIALIASLTLLPELLVLFKPYGHNAEIRVSNPV